MKPSVVGAGPVWRGSLAPRHGRHHHLGQPDHARVPRRERHDHVRGGRQEEGLAHPLLHPLPGLQHRVSARLNLDSSA